MYSKTLYKLACLAALISTGLSIPGVPSAGNALTNPTNRLHARDDDSDVPSVDDIRDEIEEAKDEYLFYSGPGGYAKKATEWSKKNGGKYKIMRQLWKDRSYPNKFQKTEKQAELFANRSSAAMAENAEGIVHVILPSDTKSLYWNKKTVWANHEWPNLPSDVTVIRVNPDDSDEEEIQGKEGEWEFSLYQNDRCSGQTSGYSGKGSTGDDSDDEDERECRTGLLNGSVNAFIPARMAANCKTILYSDDECDDEIASIKPMAEQTCTPVDSVRSWRVKCDW